MLPLGLHARIETVLGLRILRVEPVSGGCIGYACRLDTNDESYFLKWGSGSVASSFEPEAKGLEELSHAAAEIRVPRVIMTELNDDGVGVLLLEWIDIVPVTGEVWDRWGTGLAALHQCTGPYFGYESGNFIGATPQQNKPGGNWPAFFRDLRILDQVARARQQGRWTAHWDPPLERLCLRLPEILPDAPEASLVHGDLWLGNMGADRDGNPVIMDPAVYFGHREVDLAMTKLFGAPPERFFQSYMQAWPLERGFDARCGVYNLYHLINHLNLFGPSYAGSVEAILRRF